MIVQYIDIQELFEEVQYSSGSNAYTRETNAYMFLDYLYECEKIYNDVL